jgi:hypothetical protein
MWPGNTKNGRYVPARPSWLNVLNSFDRNFCAHWWTWLRQTNTTGPPAEFKMYWDQLSAEQRPVSLFIRNSSVHALTTVVRNTMWSAHNWWVDRLLCTLPILTYSSGRLWGYGHTTMLRTSWSSLAGVSTRDCGSSERGVAFFVSVSHCVRMYLLSSKCIVFSISVSERRMISSSTEI